MCTCKVRLNINTQLIITALKFTDFPDHVSKDLHRAKKLHKSEQKDRTKTLVEFPNHVLKDYGITCLFQNQS